MLQSITLLKETITVTRKATSTAIAVLMALLKHKATYRFLAAILVALGVAKGGLVATGIMTIACAYLGCIE